jgi:hypothetical protein
MRLFIEYSLREMKRDQQTSGLLPGARFLQWTIRLGLLSPLSLGLQPSAGMQAR